MEDGDDAGLTFDERESEFSFNFDTASPKEADAIAELRAELKTELESMSPFPELTSDWKLLRFVRGYKAKPSKGGKSRSKAAAKAYRDMCTYVVDHDIASIRAELIADAGGNGADREVPAEIVKKLPWPYLLPRFAPLVDGPWGGIIPVTPHGVDRLGNAVTLTVLPAYKFGQLLSDGLGDLWCDLVQSCDVYFDLRIHESSNRMNRLHARRDLLDIHGISLSEFGPKTLSLLTKMGESSKHYPEAIARTDAINFGAVGMAAFKIARAFLPKQTADKFVAHKSTFKLAEFEASDLPRRFNGVCRCMYCRKYIDTQPASATVPARGKLTLRVPLYDADVNGVARWKMLSGGGYDVGMLIEYERGGVGAANEVVREQGMCTENAGEWKVPEEGSLVITLDNEHSWMRSKSVAWWVSVSAPLSMPGTSAAEQSGGGRMQNVRKVVEL